MIHILRLATSLCTCSSERAWLCEMVNLGATSDAVKCRSELSSWIQITQDENRSGILKTFFSNMPTYPKHPDSGKCSVDSPLNLFYRAWLHIGREKIRFMTVKTEHRLPRTEGDILRHPFSCSARKSEGQTSAPVSRTQSKVRTHSNESIIRATFTAHLSI